MTTDPEVTNTADGVTLEPGDKVLLKNQPGSEDQVVTVGVKPKDEPLPLTLFVGDKLIAGNTKEAMKDAGATSGDSYSVPLDELHLMDGFNVRTDNEAYRAHVRRIADSIKANGFYGHKPIAVFVNRIDGKNVVCVTEGHTRTLAARLAVSEGAPLKMIPVKVANKGTTIEDLVVALATSNDGKPLDPMEIGLIIKRLTSFQWDMKKIAEHLAITVPYANDLLNLVGAPADVQAMVASGKVSATLAITHLKKAPEKAAAVLKEAIKKAELRGKTKATAKDTKPAEAKPKKTPGEFVEKAEAINADLKKQLSQVKADLAAVLKRDKAAEKAEAKKTKTPAQEQLPLEEPAMRPVELSYEGMIAMVSAILDKEVLNDDTSNVASKVLAALFPAAAKKVEDDETL